MNKSLVCELLAHSRELLSPRCGAAALLLCAVFAAAPVAAAPDAAPATVQRAPSRWVVAGRLLLARPAALTTGMSAGAEVGFLRAATRSLFWGVRASWSTATEYSTSWTVRHDDLRLRAVAALLARIGRARVGLRLGLGATAVYEDRELSQGERAGLPPEQSQRVAWRVLPAADLEAVVVLPILSGPRMGSWGLSVSAGPTLHIDSGASFGWIGAIGVAWQP